MRRPADARSPFVEIPWALFRIALVLPALSLLAFAIGLVFGKLVVLGLLGLLVLLGCEPGRRPPHGHGPGEHERPVPHDMPSAWY
jgi:hypothetical protein